MKYLKHIFENREEFDEDKLKDFCEVNLSYLVDEGLEVDINYEENYIIEVILSGIEISFNEIKDHLIPFLIRLKQEYSIDFFYGDEDWNISFYIEEEGDTIYYNIDNIIRKESMEIGNFFDTDEEESLTVDIMTINAITFLIKT